MSPESYAFLFRFFGAIIVISVTIRIIYFFIDRSEENTNKQISTFLKEESNGDVHLHNKLVPDENNPRAYIHDSFSLQRGDKIETSWDVKTNFNGDLLAYESSEHVKKHPLLAGIRDVELRQKTLRDAYHTPYPGTIPMSKIEVGMELMGSEIQELANNTAVLNCCELGHRVWIITPNDPTLPTVHGLDIGNNWFLITQVFIPNN